MGREKGGKSRYDNSFLCLAVVVVVVVVVGGAQFLLLLLLPFMNSNRHNNKPVDSAACALLTLHSASIRHCLVLLAWVRHELIISVYFFFFSYAPVLRNRLILFFLFSFFLSLCSLEKFWFLIKINMINKLYDKII